jgi:hypothetical protein
MRRLMVVSFLGSMLVAASVAAQGGAQVPALPSDLEQLMKQKEAEEQAASGESSVEFKPSPRSFDEMVERWMTPMRVRADGIVRLSEKYAYPHVAVPLKMEIVKEEGEFVWLKGIPPEQPDSALHDLWQQHQAEEALILHKLRFDEEVGSGFFLDYEAPLVPPAERSSVTFRKHVSALPDSGRWQMGFDIADMNGDGRDDLIFAPPRRGSPQHPLIYLGDGTGGFSYWNTITWNAAVPFDYGDVAVADYDLDGSMDLALGIHFRAQYVLYGSPEGEFRRFDKLPSPESRVTSRGVTAADFDGDGRTDLAFQAELDLDLGMGERVNEAYTAWVVMNTADGWKLNTDRMPRYVIGDRISAADMDGDDRADLVLSSSSAAWRWLVPLNRLPGPWGFSAEHNILGNSFHFDTAASQARLDNGCLPLFSAFRQSMNTEKGKEVRTGIVRYVPTNDWQSVTPELIMQDDESNSYYFRIAVGDVNGDGIEDLVASRKDVPEIEVWTQNASGLFFLERKAGVTSRGRVYDIEIHDVNGDGVGDIIIAAAGVKTKDGGGGPGGVEVWLSEPGDA